MGDGQLAINTPAVSPGLFFKDAAGALVKVGPVHVGTTAPNASPASGGTAGNSVGEQWLDTTGGTYVFKVWDGSAWRSESGTFVDVNGDTMTGALGIIAGSASTPGLFFSGDPNSGLYSPGADQVAISTGGTGRATIDSSGRLLVGTSTARTSASHTGSIQLEGTSFSTATASIITNANDSTGAYLHLGKARGGSIGSTTVVQAGDTLGQIHFTGSDGTNLINGAWVSAVVDGTPGANDLPTRLVFSTTADGASSPTERMRIDSTGKAFLTLPGTTNQPNLSLNVGGVGDPGNSSWVTPRIDFTGASLASAGTTFIGATGGLGDRSLVFATGGDAAGTERMRISSVGTTTLTSAASTAPFIANIGASEAARIDSSGRLLVGTSTYDGNARAVIQGNTSSNTTGALVVRYNGTRPASAGEGIGSIRFESTSQTSSNYHYASISCDTDGTSSSDTDIPGRLVFSTTADGASSPTERMRIKSTGTINFSNVATYADNTAALAGGLVAGDVYRKSDGTLMITY
jgi:hypothetical protein